MSYALLRFTFDHWSSIIFNYHNTNLTIGQVLNIKFFYVILFVCFYITYHNQKGGKYASFG